MTRSQEELAGRIQRCIRKGARVRFVDVNNHGFDVVDVVLIDGEPMLLLDDGDTVRLFFGAKWETFGHSSIVELAVFHCNFGFYDETIIRFGKRVKPCYSGATQLVH